MGKRSDFIGNVCIGVIKRIIGIRISMTLEGFMLILVKLILFQFWGREKFNDIAMPTFNAFLKFLPVYHLQ